MSIYMIKHKDSEECYIGSSVDIERRIREHKCKWETGTCKLYEFIDTFRSEYEEHLEPGMCKTSECHGLISYRINAEKCIMCGDCESVCEVGAIIGKPAISYFTDNLPYQILEIKCNRCGKCLEKCPQEAIEICQKELQGFLV